MVVEEAEVVVVEDSEAAGEVEEVDEVLIRVLLRESCLLEHFHILVKKIWSLKAQLKMCHTSMHQFILRTNSRLERLMKSSELSENITCRSNYQMTSRQRVLRPTSSCS